MLCRQLTGADESWLRRWMVPHDIAFAMHRQLKDYFLVETDMFGALVISPTDSLAEATTVVFWSRDHDKIYIHHIYGWLTDLPRIIRWFTSDQPVTVQMFLRNDQAYGFNCDQVYGEWHVELDIPYAGYVVDHPSYEGVFSRVAPRFPGAVFEGGPFERFDTTL